MIAVSVWAAWRRLGVIAVLIVAVTALTGCEETCAYHESCVGLEAGGGSSGGGVASSTGVGGYYEGVIDGVAAKGVGDDTTMHLFASQVAHEIFMQGANPFTNASGFALPEEGTTLSDGSSLDAGDATGSQGINQSFQGDIVYNDIGPVNFALTKRSVSDTDTNDRVAGQWSGSTSHGLVLDFLVTEDEFGTRDVTGSDNTGCLYDEDSTLVELDTNVYSLIVAFECGDGTTGNVVSYATILTGASEGGDRMYLISTGSNAVYEATLSRQ